MNTIATNLGGPITLQWGIDTHETNFYLGPQTGSITARHFNNFFFCIMRL